MNECVGNQTDIVPLYFEFVETENLRLSYSLCSDDTLLVCPCGGRRFLKNVKADARLPQGARTATVGPWNHSTAWLRRV